MDTKEILALVEKELLKEGYPPEEVADSLSKATIIITESVVTVTYDNGVFDVWDIVMKPTLAHRNKIKL